MLVGSAIGVPGPVATMRPPWTCRLSTAVGGKYNPTLVRSSPASGVTSTRSPTTISFLAFSSIAVAVECGGQVPGDVGGRAGFDVAGLGQIDERPVLEQRDRRRRRRNAPPVAARPPGGGGGPPP